MRMIKTLLFSLSVFALAACSSAPKITTDYDQQHDFGRIQSYHIIEKNRPVNDLFENRVINALDSSMAARGIKKSSAENADILIDFMAVTKDKTRVTSYNTGYGYRGFGRPYGGYGYAGGSNVDVRQYTEGTLLIDLVDPKTKQTVWRGTGSTTVRERTPEERTELANSYTEAIVQQMPLGANIKTQ